MAFTGGRQMLMDPHTRLAASRVSTMQPDDHNKKKQA